jgi:signal transduction histidine kinase
VLLEDHPFEAETIQRILLESGIHAELLSARNHAAFLKLMNSRKVDLILAHDSLLGFSALATAHVQWAEIPFIFITASIGEEQPIALLKSGATDYVQRHHLELLAPIVQRALHEAQERCDRQKIQQKYHLLQKRERQYLDWLAAVAVKNAQIHESAQQARSAAEAAQEAAQIANQMKDEFLIVLSHELRSPLHRILGGLQLLRQGQLNPQMQSEALNLIERNATLQAQLIEDLLDISQLMQGKLTLETVPVSLAPLIRAAVETVSPAAAAKKIAIALHLDPDRGIVMGDATRLQQVIWNLLSNAVKFTPSGGRVEVTLTVISGYTCDRPPESFAQIQVKDTGKGINPEFLPHVFDYFRQEESSTTRSFGGLGLGLAIARRIVELHSGTLKAESMGEGQGATFTLCLPILTADAPDLC